VFVFLRGGTLSNYEANSSGSRNGRPDPEREVGGRGPDPGSCPAPRIPPREPVLPRVTAPEPHHHLEPPDGTHSPGRGG